MTTLMALLTVRKEAEVTYRVLRGGVPLPYTVSRNDNELEPGGNRYLAWVLEKDNAADPQPLVERRTLRACVKWLEARLVPAKRAMTPEEVLQALAGPVDDFEATCREATPDTLRRALVMLSQPVAKSRPKWEVERVKWGAAFLQRILDGRLS